MTFIIGDIHSCYNEMQALLDKAGIGDDEPIIAQGDTAAELGWWRAKTMVVANGRLPPIV